MMTAVTRLGILVLLALQGMSRSANATEAARSNAEQPKPSAAARPAPPASQPAVDPKIVSELIAQLGDEDFKKRAAAAEALLRIGAPAVPALEAAKASGDAEVAARAAGLAQRIRAAAEPPPREGKAAAKVLAWITARGAGNIIGARNVGRSTQVEQASPRKDWGVLMRRDPNGIDITLLCPGDDAGGPPLKETYHAASEAELKRTTPTAYQIHEALLLSLNPDDGMRAWWRQFNPEPAE
jgi:hypothetical protein